MRDILLLGLLLFSFVLGGCSSAGVPLAEAVGDPGTVVEEFMAAIAQSRLDNAERLWHPGIPRGMLLHFWRASVIVRIGWPAPKY